MIKFQAAIYGLRSHKNIDHIDVAKVFPPNIQEKIVFQDNNIEAAVPILLIVIKIESQE